jgi:hypothetical protein
VERPAKAFRERWDCWSWPVALVGVFVFNFGLAIASVVTLQLAAKEARRTAEESLTKKLNNFRHKPHRAANRTMLLRQSSFSKRFAICGTSLSSHFGKIP